MMQALIRTRASIVWLGLIVLTATAWLLGTDHGFGPNAHVAVGVVILVVAVCKVHLIGLYFMDLRDAPLSLRVVFEGYCLLLTGVIIGMFVFG
jgi:caa(3)-type oxidase subunit IV